MLFPTALDAHTLLNVQGTISGDKSSYELSGVMVHMGTAMGGHYRAYARSQKEADANVWLDCNDASVSILSPEDITSLFWNDNPNKDKASSANEGRVEMILELIGS